MSAVPARAALPPGAASREVERHRGDAVERVRDAVAEEVPVALLYNDRPHVVMMATPQDLDDFALGFSLSEGILDAAGELESVVVTPLLEGIELRLRVPPARAEALEERRRNLTGRTSCGLCGAQALEDAVRQPAAVRGGPRIDDAILRHALAQMHERQPLNAVTGATHAAAWARVDGTLAHVREDVGRHNALDKLVGALVRAGEDVHAGFLVVTSRASYEMVQKAATAGIALIAAISAPTALAIQLAETTGVTLIGFARRDSHVVYTQPQRLAARQEASP
ncbi:formate dehydrogenase accessory sulfurtransferase FdhD [Dokdonella sp.]|uniref:formate dehydrogenase accessory sulfurtransferase FdhD n=1 Tax=Dokdonella sp. TaxID=2291710 RepID=UPI002622ECCF|nr:formate dehydrogenase accessory sulfurtransferase FdhD [Dokdonella sp.]